jgi:folate-dependent phosphoribosylglycinamide formyltransferase PurN
MTKKLRLAIGADGGGTCFQSVLDNAKADNYDFEVACLFTAVPGCGAIGRAQKENIPVIEVP